MELPSYPLRHWNDGSCFYVNFSCSKSNFLFQSFSQGLLDSPKTSSAGDKALFFEADDFEADVDEPVWNHSVSGKNVTFILQGSSPSAPIALLVIRFGLKSQTNSSKSLRSKPSQCKVSSIFNQSFPSLAIVWNKVVKLRQIVQQWTAEAVSSAWCWDLIPAVFHHIDCSWCNIW